MTEYNHKKTSVEHTIDTPQNPLNFLQYNQIIQSLSHDLTKKKHRETNIHTSYAGYLKVHSIMGPVGSIQYKFGVATGKPEIYYHNVPGAECKYHMTF